MATIVTDVGEGTLTGDFTFTGTAWDTVVVRVAKDANNYCDLSLYFSPQGVEESYWILSAGAFLHINNTDIPLYTGSVAPPMFAITPVPTFEIALALVGRGLLEINASILTTGEEFPTTSLVFDEAFWGLGNTYTISNPTGTGESFVWTDAPPYVAPEPEISPWYSKQLEIASSDAYGSVTFLQSDSTNIVYSNDESTDPELRLISIETQEYFDPTTRVTTVNSCLVTIKTPLDDTSTQTDIDAFLALFSSGNMFWIDRGWMLDGTPDTVKAGIFRIDQENTELDRNTWNLTVAGVDAFWQYTLITAEYQDITFSPLKSTEILYGEGVFPALMDFSQSSRAIDNNFYDYFTDLNRYTYSYHLEAPISNEPKRSEHIASVVNAMGAFWYLEDTGLWTLETDDGHREWSHWFDYKITPHMVYGKPIESKYRADEPPYTAAIYDYSYERELSDLALVPKIRDSGHKFWIRHEGTSSQSLFERVGDVDTFLDKPIEYTGMYNTLLDGTVWLKSPGVYYDTLVLKGYKLVVGTTKNDPSESPSEGTTLENPFITQTNQADAALSWSFPDFKRQWEFEMRDDPALKCGRVVQLTVDNEYLNVLITEIKRTFTGSGRMTVTAVYISDTGEAPYQTAVINATATFLDETSPISGVTLAWDNVSGYDDWPNLDLRYNIYRTSTDPDVLLATVQYPTNTLENLPITALIGADTFGVSVVTNNLEWPAELCTNIYYDNTADDDRFSGEFMFYAGQPRLW